MKKQRIILMIAVTLLVSVLHASLTAQTNILNKTQLDKKIDSLFKDFNNTSSPGYAITILQNGKVITQKDYGLASLEHKVPFNHNTVVTIPYSEGREFISIAAALLEQDGKLKLEDKVRKYFPKLPAWSNP